MRSRAVVGAALAALVGVVAPSEPAAAVVHDVDLFVAAPGPLGAVTVIGDSVLLGSGVHAPTLADRLAEHGWGPVRLRAVDGLRTGLPPDWPERFDGSALIDRWQAEGWDAPSVIVNLGANDSGYCGSDVGCARAAILRVVDAIGPDKQIWWPKITRLYSHGHQAAAWNAALDQVAGERAGFATWDWPAEMASPGYGSWDGTHLYPDGYRRRSSVMARVFTETHAVARRTGDDAALPVATADVPGGYTPVEPVRLADTRVLPGGAVAAGGVLPVDLSAHVDPDASAVAVSVTAVGPAGPGYLTAYPCDRQRPIASTVNYIAGHDRAAAALLPLAADQRLCVFTDVRSDIVVDLHGQFVPDAGDLGLVPAATPLRLVDTRATGRADEVRVDVPGATGDDVAAVTLTATGAAGPGFLTAHDCDGAAPVVSHLNFATEESIAASAFVPLGDDGSLCVHASNDVDVLIDLTGTLTTTGALGFVPAVPTRVLDTRAGVGGWSPVHGRGQTVDVRVAPAGAGAVSGTLTIVDPVGGGFLQTDRCDARPPTSSVNAGPAGVLANAVTTAVSAEGRLCVSASTTTHTLFDTTGWWQPRVDAGMAGPETRTAMPVRRASPFTGGVSASALEPLAHFVSLVEHFFD